MTNVNLLTVMLVFSSRELEPLTFNSINYDVSIFLIGYENSKRK